MKMSNFILVYLQSTSLKLVIYLRMLEQKSQLSRVSCNLKRLLILGQSELYLLPLHSNDMQHYLMYSILLSIPKMLYPITMASFSKPSNVKNTSLCEETKGVIRTLGASYLICRYKRAWNKLSQLNLIHTLTITKLISPWGNGIGTNTTHPQGFLNKGLQFEVPTNIFVYHQPGSPYSFSSTTNNYL